MRIAAAALALALALALAAAAAPAQEIASPVLVIDRERLFSESAFGARLVEEIEQRSAALSAENRRIEAELIEEERELTERRPQLDPQEFRALADAFDEKVQRLRAQQDEKARDLTRLRDAERSEFVQTVGPILSDLVRERGAVVVLDRRDVFLSSEAIDITEEAIERIDAEAGADAGAGAGAEPDGGGGAADVPPDGGGAAAGGEPPAD